MADPIPLRPIPADHEAERAVLGALLLADDGVLRIDGSLRAEDFDLPRHRLVFAAIIALARRGEPPSTVLVRRELEERGSLAQVGGYGEICKLADGVATAAQLEFHAALVRRSAETRALLRGYERLAARANAGIEPEELLAETAELVGAVESSKPKTASVDLEISGFTGDRLRATRGRAIHESPLPNLLDPRPHLHVVLGKPKTAKTTFCLALAQAWAEASEPWDGARPLPGGRVLVISREQDITRLDGTLRRLALYGGRRDSETWENQMTIVARDDTLGPELASLLTLDAKGLALLRAGLAHAREANHPYTLLVLDSLSRLKPLGLDEWDNDGMTAWLDELEGVASEFACYILLIHHVGHSADEGRHEARGAGRGASAIAAVAQAIWLLERVKADPALRRLEVDGNAILPGEHFFRVSDPTAEPGAVNYFRPHNPLLDHQPTDYLEPGEIISLSELGRRLSGISDPAEGLTGSAKRLAKEVLASWKQLALVDVSDRGQRKGLAIRLRERSGFMTGDGAEE